VSGNGKRGRGGQRGNLNAARSVLPALRRLRGGEPLPPGLARVAALADRGADHFAASKGGREHMSAGELLMLGVWHTAKMAELIILDELVERGAVVVEDGRWDLQPGLGRLVKFLAEQRAALLALGLGSRARDVNPLQAIRAKVQAARHGGGS